MTQRIVSNRPESVEAALERRTAGNQRFWRRAMWNDQDLRERADQLLSAHESTATLSQALPEQQQPVPQTSLPRRQAAGRPAKSCGCSAAAVSTSAWRAVPVRRSTRTSPSRSCARTRPVPTLSSASTASARFGAAGSSEHCPAARCRSRRTRTAVFRQWSMSRAVRSPVCRPGAAVGRDRIALFGQVCDAVDYAHSAQGGSSRSPSPATCWSTQEPLIKCWTWHCSPVGAGGGHQ